MKMAKSDRKSANSTHSKSQSSNLSTNVDRKALDPTLTFLFNNSSGPVTAPSRSRLDQSSAKQSTSISESKEGPSHNQGIESYNAESDGSDSNASVLEEDEPSNVVEFLNGADSEADVQTELGENKIRVERKRKRQRNADDVEDIYMEKIAREEERDEERRKKKQKIQLGDDVDKPRVNQKIHTVDGPESDNEPYSVPVHETLNGSQDAEALELEKAGRTVFLGNVSNEAILSKAAAKQLKQHLSSFLSDLPINTPPHRIESIRYRSTAFAGAQPKRAAFAKRETMDATTKSTNAYIVYTTKVAAREAVKRLNGTVILGRHLRIDSVAHPYKVDHRRCVFVGNLGFVDDDSKQKAEDGEVKKKSKPPSDVEEGLWTHFAKAGKIESVRVPRDAQTRIGKGFAYVQFADENSVEAALEFNDQKFPPLLPRKLRVVRARTQKKPSTTLSSSAPAKTKKITSDSGYRVKLSDEQKSNRGRARAVLGKAAASSFKSAESIVFEGHRASSRQGTSGLKLGKKGKGKGAVKKGMNGRRARSQAWKSGGGKK